jgi:hypothetical protein
MKVWTPSQPFHRRRSQVGQKEIVTASNAVPAVITDDIKNTKMLYRRSPVRPKSPPQ